MKNITYKIIKIVIVIGILSSVFSCKVEKDISIYRTEEFKKKEKTFKLSLDEAGQKCIKYILKEEIANDGFFELDIIYGDYYIFKPKGELYNLKTGNYNLSGIWINGNTGEIKEVKTNENIKILLEYNSHMPYMRRITKDSE
ncbi:hypothetical protein [Capnocytophaga gingivalis]|uniref:Lipoprotein n=1 Tax=Capnocytophaga gingivalis TaxID=1017 RepID=A0ABU5Z5L6_9FLAO|nr:hypothetical protein [Capnocytophaga gingivalis]MEB3073733.1 hypothetical protein [Capnocytophaga gingivalis]